MRINLPFALVDVRIHLGEVRLPLAACRAVIVGIGIRVMADEGELAVDYTDQEVAEKLILLRKSDIRPHLGTGIPEPHGVNVSGIDECPPVSILVLAEMNSGIESIRETVGKHPGQLLVLEEA